MSVKVYGVLLAEWRPDIYAVGLPGRADPAPALAALDKRREWIRSKDWRDSTLRLSQPGLVIGEGKAERDALAFRVGNPTAAPLVVWMGQAVDAIGEPRSFGEPLEGREWIVEAPPFAESVRLYTIGFDWGVDFRDPRKRAGASPWKVRVLISPDGRDVAELEALDL